MLRSRTLEPEHYPFFDYRRFTFSLGIAAANSVWLSGSTAVRFETARKAMVVEGDLIEQAAVIFEKMRLTLMAGELGLRDIVRIVQYVTPRAIPDQAPAQRPWSLRFLQVPPAISVIVVKSLLRPEALIEIEAVASLDGHSSIEYLPTLSEADAPKAWSLADDILASRGLRRQDVIRAVELMTPAADSNNASGAFLRVTMPRLVDDRCCVQLELGAASNQRSDLVFVSAMGDPGAGGVGDQCRDIYARFPARRSTRALPDTVAKTTDRNVQLMST